MGTETDTVVPMSLRTTATERRYGEYRASGKLGQLKDMPSLVEFEAWRIINNEFPPDMAYQTAHLLLPKREVPTYGLLTVQEQIELRQIIDEYCQLHYDQVTENMQHRRSVLGHYHLHLLTFYPTRAEVRL